MTKQVAKSTPSGRFNTAPSLAIARQIASNDSASAAAAATCRFECRCRELSDRFEQELQGVRSVGTAVVQISHKTRCSPL